MHIEVPYSYTPTLTHEARRLLPPGMELQLGGSVPVEIPELSGEEAPVALTAVHRRHDVHLA